MESIGGGSIHALYNQQRTKTYMFTPESNRGFIRTALSSVSAFAKSVLSPRATKFVEAGYVDACMNITPAGVEAFHVIAMSKWGDELEAMADEVIAERKASSK